MTPQETEPDLPVSVQESPAEAWVNSGLLRGQGHWIKKVQEKVLLKEVAITTITPTIVRPQAKQQKGNTGMPINRKLH